MKIRSLLAVAVGAGLCAVAVARPGDVKDTVKEPTQVSAQKQASPLDFTVKTIDGKEQKLSDYKGKVVLLVNVASKCGLTPQYTALESTYEKYKDQGFVIVGFPANNFGSQEPGTNEEIKQFCTAKYNVTQLVWYDSFPEPAQAIAWEKRIKGWSRAKKIALVEESNPLWLDLSDRVAPDAASIQDPA